MTRFEKEISGTLGEYWKKSAEKEVTSSVNDADNNAIVEEDGAIKWKNNGNYLMDDFCERLEYAGYNFSRSATAKKREKQNKEFIESYRNNNPGFTEEQINEMKSIFGNGTKVVDILSGEEILL